MVTLWKRKVAHGLSPLKTSFVLNARASIQYFLFDFVSYVDLQNISYTSGILNINSISTKIELEWKRMVIEKITLTGFHLLGREFLIIGNAMTCQVLEEQRS